MALEASSCRSADAAAMMIGGASAPGGGATGKLDETVTSPEHGGTRTRL
jgi:hypothetical protein